MTDSLFSFLHEATPDHLREKTDRATLIRAVGSSPAPQIEALFAAYSKCRSREPWMQKLMKNRYRYKSLDSFLARFRSTLIEALRDRSMWCDLYLARLWVNYTKTSLYLCLKDGRALPVAARSDDNNVLASSSALYLNQPTQSSCRFSLAATAATAATTDKEMIDEIEERMIRQCVRASRYTLHLDGATGTQTRSKKSPPCKK